MWFGLAGYFQNPMQDAIYVAVTWEIIWYRFANWYSFLENVTIHMTFLGAVADDI